MRKVFAIAAALLLGGTLAMAQRVTVEQRELEAERVTVLEQSGRLRQLTPQQGFVELAAGEYLAARLDEQVVARSAGDRIRWQLPVRMIGADADGERLSLRPVVEIAGGGLRFRPQEGGFGGRLLIGLEDEDDASRTRSLGQSVSLLVTAQADSTTPDTVALDHTNLPFAEVEIVARRPEDEVGVRIRPEFDPEGIEVSVPVVRPRLVLRASPVRIQGLGLETSVLTLSALETAAGAVEVALSSDRSKPEPPIVTLSEGGKAQAVIRSSGIGVATVVAESEPLEAAEVTVEFVFPWAFLVSALLGGLVGGVIRFFQLKTKKAEKILLVPLVLHVLLGLLLGLVTAVAWAVGINLLDVHPSAITGEAVVFVLAALGAMTSGALVNTILPGNAGRAT